MSVISTIQGKREHQKGFVSLCKHHFIIGLKLQYGPVINAGLLVRRSYCRQHTNFHCCPDHRLSLLNRWGDILQPYRLLALLSCLSQTEPLKQHRSILSAALVQTLCCNVITYIHFVANKIKHDWDDKRLLLGLAEEMWYLRYKSSSMF